MNYCYITKLALIVSDEKPNYLDFYITTVKDSNGIRFTKGQRLDKDNSDYSDCKKIIAELPSINYSKLSLEEQNRLGWIDVEGLAREIYQPEMSSISQFAHDLAEPKRKAFKRGLTHQLSIKRYTEEQMINFAEYCFKESFADNGNDYSISELLELWDKPELIPIEIEMEHPHDKCILNKKEKTFTLVPKITNSQITILKCK